MIQLVFLLGYSFSYFTRDSRTLDNPSKDERNFASTYEAMQLQNLLCEPLT